MMRGRLVYVLRLLAWRIILQRFLRPHMVPQKALTAIRKLIDICLATSSAPIIFPIAHISDPEGNGLNKESFVDGGLWDK